MICGYVTVRKNGQIVTDSASLSNGDIVQVTVEEQRKPGYVFDCWVDENYMPINPQPYRIPGTGNPVFEIQVFCNGIWNVRFKKKVTPTYVVSGNTNSPYGYVVGGESAEYPMGSSTSMIAVCEDDCCYEFVGWYEDFTNHAPVFVTNDTVLYVEDIQAPHTYVAEFIERFFTINATPVDGQGNVLSEGYNITYVSNPNYGNHQFPCGTEVTFTATVEDGYGGRYEFLGWRVNGVMVGGNSSDYTFTVSCENKDDVLEAVYRVLPNIQITVNYDDVEIGQPTVIDPN